jgi:3-methylornithine--L-lysine ligase
LTGAGMDIARATGLQGVMDVEVMLAGDEPCVIEIDARLPSQTPTVVYQASGVNMVALLAEAGLTGTMPQGSCEAAAGVVLQHVLASGGRLRVLGEHILREAGPLRLERGFFGAREALTDFEPGARRWAATVIVREPTLADARAAADEVVERMATDLCLALAPEDQP